MTRFMRFSRWGAQLGALDALSAVHTEGLDGTDQVVVRTADDIPKGERIVWADSQGVWHEHIADSVVRTHGEDGAEEEVTYVSSLSELWDDYVEEKQPSGTAYAALTSILSGTRWSAGTVDVGGSKSRKFYHISVREGIQELAETWGGEVYPQIEVSQGAVSKRMVALAAQRGDAHSKKRFSWTKDITSITREVVSDNPKTRVYGYGKGVETDSGGFGRRLTFSDVNGGKAYVEDAEATKVWGHPGPDGSAAPAVGTYINEQCDDARQLLAETKAYLDRVKAPVVSYTADVVDLAAHGRDWEGVALGDTVAIIDNEFCLGGVRLTGRIVQIERDLLGGGTVVTFGNVSEAMTGMLASFAQALQGAQSQRATVDAVAGTSGAWLLQLQKALNEQFDKAGSYQVSSFELGNIWSNVPLDEATGRPRERLQNMWAININGAGFRIASGLKADGSWDWRTFGTGAGFTADCLNVGTIKGGSNTWNLSTGDLRFLQGSIVINGPSGTQVTIDAANGFRITQNGRLVGGLEIVDGQAHLRAARAGTSAANYVTTGTVVGGNPGASFVNQYGNYLDIEALHAVDDPSGNTTGIGMAVFDRPFLDASTYYNRLWLHRPGTSQTYLEHPPEQLYIGDNSVHLQYSGTCGAFISPTAMSFRWNNSAGLLMGDSAFSYVRNKQDQGLYMQNDMIAFIWSTGRFEISNSHAIMKFNDSTYLELTPSGLTCRHGSTGFRHTASGWEELTW